MRPRFLAIFLAAAVCLAGCKRKPATTEDSASREKSEAPSPSSSQSPEPALSPTPRPTLAANATGAVALDHAQKICAFGSRAFPAPGRLQTRQYLLEQMAKAGWNLTPQPFQALTPAGPRDFSNLIGRFKRPDGTVARIPVKFIFVAHYDAPESKFVVFPAASEGASGCGALLELASILTKDPELAEKVAIVFCDGEAPVHQNTGFDGLNGSRFYARILKENDQIEKLSAVIVLGAIGHKNAVWTLPAMTSEPLDQSLEATAVARNWPNQTSRLGRPAWGGHLPFLEAGAPVAALLDANFLAQDTADDVPEVLDIEPIKRAIIALLDIASK